jgi:hypothetical protein
VIVVCCLTPSFSSKALVAESSIMWLFDLLLLLLLLLLV